MNIEIVNLRKTKPTRPNDFHVSRGTPVGNPFWMPSELDRNKVCDKYQIWFDSQLESGSPAVLNYLNEILEALRLHRHVRLFCWCAPKRCHATTIKAWLEDNV